MNTDDITLPKLKSLRERDVTSVTRLPGGGNNRVYKVERQSAEPLVIKFYFSNPDDQRDRIGVEYTAHEFLWREGIREIAEPIELNRAAFCAVYSFLEGTRPSMEMLSPDDILQATDFALCLRPLTDSPRARNLPAASEAGFSLSSLASSLEDRASRLLAVSAGESPIFDRFRSFLEDELIVAMEEWKERAVALSASLETGGFGTSLPLGERTLSPSDFGFHNGIKGVDGRWRFYDFEYFGWDDPAKLLSDFILHPAMHLSDRLQKVFLEKMLGTWGSESLRNRLSLVYPLYGIKWCFIFLNEFIPSHRARRGFAGQISAANLEEVQKRQLDKARALLNRLKSPLEIP